MGIIGSIIIGALAGFLAGKIMKGSGYGILGNIILGILGGFAGGFVFKLLGIAATGIIGQLVAATTGAVLLLFLFSKTKKAET